MKWTRKIEAALFDMDGTLVSSELVWQLALQWSLKERGADVPLDVIRDVQGGHAWQDIFLEIQRRWPWCFSDRRDMELLNNRFYDDYAARHDLAIPSSIALLKRLHGEGLKTAIVSGSTQERLRNNMDQLGIVDDVDLVLGCDDYVHGKPAPECYLLAAERLGVLPEACVVFEDASTGVCAAKAAGMTCVARKNSIPQDYSMADLVLENLNDFQLPTEAIQAIVPV